MGKFTIQDIALKPLLLMFVVTIVLHWAAVRYVEESSCKPRQVLHLNAIPAEKSMRRTGIIVEDEREHVSDNEGVPLPRGNKPLIISDDDTLQLMKRRRVKRVKRSAPRLGSPHSQITTEVNVNYGENWSTDGKSSFLRGETGELGGNIILNHGGTTPKLLITKNEVIHKSGIHGIARTESQQRQRGEHSTGTNSRFKKEGEMRQNQVVKSTSPTIRRTTKSDLQYEDYEKPEGLHLTSKRVPKRVEFETLENYDQLDPFLIDYVCTYHLYPPSKLIGNEVVETVTDATEIANHIYKELEEKTNGIFVEIGSEKLSEALILERKFDWSGLLIEGSPRYFQTTRVRKRQAWQSDVLVSPLTTPRLISYHETSVTEANQTADNKDTGGSGSSASGYELLSIPIRTLLTSAKLRSVDYLAFQLRTPEWNIQIANTFPFHSIPVQIISIRSDLPGELDKELRQAIELQNYRKLEIQLPNKYLYKKI